MILINVLTVLICVHILFKAKQETEKNRRTLRAVRETKRLRHKRK